MEKDESCSIKNLDYKIEQLKKDIKSLKKISDDMYDYIITLSRRK